MFSYFINIQYCYEYLINQISIGLLLYTHLPAASIAFAFSIYALIKAKNLSSFFLFLTCLTFTMWVISDLGAWFEFVSSANTMFFWSLLDFLAVLMFFFGYYFLYVFSTGKDLPLWQKLIGIGLLLPTTYVALTGLNIPVYDLNSCAALEDRTFTIYSYYAEALFILAILIFVISRYRHSKERAEKARVLLASTGMLIFLAFFFSASFLVSLLAATDVSLYVYNYLLYGLIGMPIFLVYLGYLTVRYHEFNVKLIATQALAWALFLTTGSQLFYVQSGINLILTEISTIMPAIFGILLVRSVKREVEQKE